MHAGGSAASAVCTSDRSEAAADWRADSPLDESVPALSVAANAFWMALRSETIASMWDAPPPFFQARALGWHDGDTGALETELLAAAEASVLSVLPELPHPVRATAAAMAALASHDLLFTDNPLQARLLRRRSEPDNADESACRPGVVRA
jgi:hypothetical protein